MREYTSVNKDYEEREEEEPLDREEEQEDEEVAKWKENHAPFVYAPADAEGSDRSRE